MRLPRMTTRRMMIVVAMVAVILYGRELWRARSEYLLLASQRGRAEADFIKERTMWQKQAARLGPNHVVGKWSKAQADEAARYAGYYAKLRRTYEEAARHPWRPAPVIKNEF